MFIFAGHGAGPVDAVPGIGGRQAPVGIHSIRPGRWRANLSGRDDARRDSYLRTDGQIRRTVAQGWHDGGRARRFRVPGAFKKKKLILFKTFLKINNLTLMIWRNNCTLCCTMIEFYWQFSFKSKFSRKSLDRRVYNTYFRVMSIDCYVGIWCQPINIVLFVLLICLSHYLKIGSVF